VSRQNFFLSCVGWQSDIFAEIYRPVVSSHIAFLQENKEVKNLCRLSPQKSQIMRHFETAL